MLLTIVLPPVVLLLTMATFDPLQTGRITQRKETLVFKDKDFGAKGDGGNICIYDAEGSVLFSAQSKKYSLRGRRELVDTVGKCVGVYRYHRGPLPLCNLL